MLLLIVSLLSSVDVCRWSQISHPWQQWIGSNHPELRSAWIHSMRLLSWSERAMARVKYRRTQRRSKSVVWHSFVLAPEASAILPCVRCCFIPDNLPGNSCRAN